MNQLNQLRKNHEKRKVMIWLSCTFLLLIVLSSFALLVSAEEADAFLLSSRIIKNKVAPGEWAEFEIDIYNGYSYPETFRIVNQQEGVEWSLLTDPKTFIDGIVLKGKEQQTFRVRLKDINLTRDYKRPYHVLLDLKGKESHYVKTLRFPVYLMPGSYSDQSLFQVIPQFPSVVDPNQPQSFKVTITNTNWKDYPQIKVSLTSNFFSRETLIGMLANTSKTLDFPVELPNTVDKGSDTVLISLSDPATKEQFARTSVTYQVLAPHAPFERELETEKSFLLYTDTIRIKNPQNFYSEQSLRIPTSFLERFLGSTDPELAREEIDGKLYYTIKLRLGPQESFVITITTNYRMIVYALIALALLIYTYYMFKSPIVVVKQAENIRLAHDGLRELTVVLTVANRSKKAYSNVEVFDRVPKLMQLYHRVDQTFRPYKTTHHPNGDIISWQFDLTPQEERIIRYVLSPKIEIIGDLRLPKALMKFYEDGTPVRVQSNELDVSTGASRSERMSEEKPE